MIDRQSDERLITAFSTHWIKYARPICMYALFMGVAFLLFALATIAAHHQVVLAEITFGVGLLIALGVHHWFFHYILSEGMDDVIITNKRLVFLDECLWFCDNMHEVHLKNIQAVEAKKNGFLQNLLRYGSLWFDTGGTALEGGRVIPLVPNPHRKAKMITDLLRDNHL